MRRAVAGEESAFAISVCAKLVMDFMAVRLRGVRSRRSRSAGPLGKLTRRHWDVPMDYEHSAQMGAVMGNGGIVVHDDTANIWIWCAMPWSFVTELVVKRTPCRIGSAWG